MSSVAIPSSVTTLIEYAFSDCSGLKTATAACPEIARRTFYGCSALESVTLSGTVTIGESAFEGCSTLPSIAIPSSVTKIDYSAFYGCNSLTSVHITDLAKWCAIHCNDNPLHYAHHLFLNGEELTEVAIPDGVAAIGQSTFYGLSAMTKLTIPSSVTAIGGGAFQDCTGLKLVVIPASVGNIGNTAFWNCTALDHIYCRVAAPSTVALGNAVFARVPVATCTLHVPVGTGDAYREAEQWKAFTVSDDLVDPLFPDVNSDSVVDVGDVNVVLGAILDGATDMVCDINSDGVVDVGDVNAVLDRILNP